MRRLLAMILMLCAGTAGADIYKKQLPDGSTGYSDQPDPQAEKIEPPRPQTYTPIAEPQPSAAPVSRAAPQPVTGYLRLTIAAPANDAVIWDDEGKVGVGLTIEPALQIKQGHRIVIRMDGSLVQGPSTATRYTLADVDRGTHQVQGSVVDAGGQSIIDSPIVTFHVKRHSILHQQPR